MKTEEQIYDMIEHYKERGADHHILLNTPLVQNVIFAHLNTIIATLEWVLDESQESQSLPTSTIKEN